MDSPEEQNSALHRESLEFILGDAVQAVCRAYYTTHVHDADLKQRVYERLLSYGIDPENETIILSSTKDSRIPWLFSPIIEEDNFIPSKCYGTIYLCRTFSIFYRSNVLSVLLNTLTGKEFITNYL